MKKNDLGKSPSKKLKLKPWVRDTIEVSKVLGECAVRLSIIVLIVLGGIKIFDTPKVELSSELNTNQVEEVVIANKTEKEVKEEEPKETHEDKIARLIADVESGKAGNGDARKEYLGEDYNEVQEIINKKYPPETKSRTTSKQSTSVAKSVTGDKAEYQSYAYDLCINTYGWSESDFNALIILWDRESSWSPNAHNKSSGAHGIPQSLPASKMASEGSDYMTNYQTQIRWGLKYIKNRYNNPSNALDHSNKKGWY